VFHTDTSRLDPQVDGPLFPMVLRIDAEPPTASVSELPVTVGPPVLDERNHFSYAMQWFAFATLALVTYGAWLWSRRGRPTSGPTRDDDHPNDDDDRPDGPAGHRTPPRRLEGAPGGR
jgi:hypothetical protein